MPVILQSVIILLLFISTVLSGNPKTFCVMPLTDTICNKIIKETPKNCSSCKMKKMVEPEYTPDAKPTDCNLPTKDKFKDCFKCSFSQPIRSAILSVQKTAVNLKTFTKLNQIFINTSNRDIHNLSKMYIPKKIHNTIALTILLL